MAKLATLPLPRLDASLWGAHRLFGLSDPGLRQACGVALIFTGRNGGLSTGVFASLNTGSAVGDAPSAVAENRLRVTEALGAAQAPFVVPNQVHGDELIVVKSSETDALTTVQAAADQGADGLVIETSGVGALLNFADCLPLVLVAPNGNFAVVHCGWRGTVASIAAKAVDALAQGSQINPNQFNGYIGPHIRQECFQVGEDVAAIFEDKFGPSVLDGRQVSLAAAVIKDLQSAGMDSNRIVDAGICTQCHCDEFFSYRASGGNCGRHCAAAICLT